MKVNVNPVGCTSDKDELPILGSKKSKNYIGHCWSICSKRNACLVLTTITTIFIVTVIITSVISEHSFGQCIKSPWIETSENILYDKKYAGYTPGIVSYSNCTSVTSDRLIAIISDVPRSFNQYICDTSSSGYRLYRAKLCRGFVYDCFATVTETSQEAMRYCIEEIMVNVSRYIFKDDELFTGCELDEETNEVLIHRIAVTTRNPIVSIWQKRICQNFVEECFLRHF